MKKRLKQLLSVVLILILVLASQVPAFSGKNTTKRSISIVFDNSGSMYVSGEKAWCRATYAMEVFASMLNSGDSLQIHPMNPIKVGGNEYTMNNPFVITDPSQASQIREINTEKALDTHIETIDAAINTLNSSQADEKYMIVLTDGQVFYEGGKELSVSNTVAKLSERFSNAVGPNLNILYLGIGSKVAMPQVNSEYYVGEKASDSANVLSTLTMMCNRIFARDTLPASNINGSTMNFDISMSKLIVFVQGENVSDVKVTGKNGATATEAGSAKAQYSTVGAANYKGGNKSAVDTSLQGMLVTYTDCSSGEYELSYSGTPSSIEVYYEPDADLNFIFTDQDGNLVDPESLYKGDYKVQYGLVDAQTGELISSSLLGNPTYQGKYVINGQEYPISHTGYSGETPVSLDVGDTFTAQLTASYLNGYSITKDATDFGWPSDTLTVDARPSGDVRLEISGGDKTYELSSLEKGSTYTAKVYYQDVQLTGPELQRVELRWDREKSNAEITQEFKDDHFALHLEHKDPSNPLSTKCGKCTVTIFAHYTPDGSTETIGQSPLTYKIEDNATAPKLRLEADQDYFQISKLDKGDPIEARITMDGKKLSPEQFAALNFSVDCDGIGYTVTPVPEKSLYEIKLNSKGKTSADDYKISASVTMKDPIGREVSSEDSCEIELGLLPLWLKWAIWILLILAIIVIAYVIAHKKCLPTKLNTNKKICEMNVGGEDVTNNTAFKAEIDSGILSVEAKYSGIKTGLKMDVVPGRDSYLITKQTKRKATVKAQSVKRNGGATIEEATIGTKQYILNEESGKFESAITPAKDFDLSNGNVVTYSGTMQLNGVTQNFYARIKLNYRKK